jgi:hypothetical protein
LCVSTVEQKSTVQVASQPSRLEVLGCVVNDAAPGSRNQWHWEVVLLMATVRNPQAEPRFPG